MNKLVIKNSNQLRQFLQVLAEESVNQANMSLNGKTQQQRVAADIAASKKSFMGEQDPAAPGETPAPSSAPAAEPPDESPPAEPAKQDTESSGRTSEISPKYEALVDAINDLRGVPSTRDSTVDLQLRAYYDRLDSAEAASAILYIRTIGDVMRGDVKGAEAPDPTEFMINTTMKTSSTPAEQPKVAAPAQPPGGTTSSEPEVVSPEEEEEEEGEENTAPPIKVGGGQVTEAYRLKIRKLMGI